MNAFVRQITVLSALWAVCELILPDGPQQKMVRMTASLLVMAALLSTVSGWTGDGSADQPVMAFRVQQASEDAYRRTALKTLASQTERYCVRTAQRAGYEADAVVYLTMDGALDHIELTLLPSSAVLMDVHELVSLLERQLQADHGSIQVSVEK